MASPVSQNDTVLVTPNIDSGIAGMGLFRGAVFRHGGGARKQSIKQPTEMPTRTMALMGRFPLLMGHFRALTGHFLDFILRGRLFS